MSNKGLIEGLSFEEYLRKNPMPTRELNTTNYRIVEVRRGEE